MAWPLPSQANMAATVPIEQSNYHHEQIGQAWCPLPNRHQTGRGNTIHSSSQMRQALALAASRLGCEQSWELQILAQFPPVVMGRAANRL